MLKFQELPGAIPLDPLPELCRRSRVSAALGPPLRACQHPTIRHPPQTPTLDPALYQNEELLFCITRQGNQSRPICSLSSQR